MILPALGEGSDLDLPYEVDARREGSVPFLPLSGADLTWVFVDELSSLDLAKELASVTTDTVVMDLSYLEDTVGVVEEGTTVSLASLFDHDPVSTS